MYAALSLFVFLGLFANHHIFSEAELVTAISYIYIKFKECMFIKLHFIVYFLLPVACTECRHFTSRSLQATL